MSVTLDVSSEHVTPGDVRHSEGSREPSDVGTPRPRIRVTHVVFGLDRGGLESIIGALAKQFSGSGVAMSVITLNGFPGRVGARIRPEVEHFQVVRPIPKLSMVLPLGLARCIRRTRPDVVHLHSGAWFKGVAAARLAGVKRVVYTEHGLLPHESALGRWVRKRAAAWTDVVIPVSTRLRRHLIEVEGVPDDRVHMIENGVDVDRYCPGPYPEGLRETLGIPPDSFVIGSVGRLAPVKAYHDLMRAYAQVRLLTGNARPMYLVICGEGRERESLERLAGELGIADTVRLPGWVDDPTPYYRLFHVFALTSSSEGSPVSLLEAMSCGVVPVVTAVGTMASTLGPELAEQSVTSGDIDAIANRLHNTVLQGDRRVRLARLARARVEREFSVKRMAEKYERVYWPSLPGERRARGSAGTSNRRSVVPDAMNDSVQKGLSLQRPLDRGAPATKLREIFSSVFGVKADSLTDDDSPKTIEGWDSINHINLVLAIEGEFDVVFEPEEIADLNTFGAIRARLDSVSNA